MSPTIRKRRAAKWVAEFIPCKRHPWRQAIRSTYITGGHHRCGSCNHRRADGSYRPNVLRDITSGNSKWRKQELRSVRRIDERKF